MHGRDFVIADWQNSKTKCYNDFGSEKNYKLVTKLAKQTLSFYSYKSVSSWLAILFGFMHFLSCLSGDEDKPAKAYRLLCPPRVAPGVHLEYLYSQLLPLLLLLLFLSLISSNKLIIINTIRALSVRR
jgi:hypothetical protein